MPQPDYEIFFHDVLSTGRDISSFHDTYNDEGILLMFHCLYRRHLQDKNNFISKILSIILIRLTKEIFLEPKGQLISKGYFGVFKPTKNTKMSF